MTPDDLSERLWQFAARVGKVVDALPDTRLAAMWPDNWSNQLLLPNRMAAAAQSHRRPGQFEIFIYQFSIFNSMPSNPLPAFDLITMAARNRSRTPTIPNTHGSEKHGATRTRVSR